MVELLVVIAVVGVLVAILLPVLSRAKRQGQRVQCINNLRQIGLGTALYADDFGGRLHHRRGTMPNGGQWTLNPSRVDLLDAGHSLAYWGLAYLAYVEGAIQLFRCPSAWMVDEWREEGKRYPREYWLNSSYGANRHVVQPYDAAVAGPLSIADLRHPESTVFAQDAAEQRMEGPTDSCGLFPGQTELFTEWRVALRPLYPDHAMEWEWYRHDQRSEVLWAAGQVTALRFNGWTRGVDYQWYGAPNRLSPH